MRTTRTRKAAAILCIAIVVFAPFALTAAFDFHAVLTPLWLITPPVIVTVVRRTAARSAEQPVSLASIPASRAPPPAAA